MTKTKIGPVLGIDLSGYQTRKTALVRLTIVGDAAVFRILEDHPFSTR